MIPENIHNKLIEQWPGRKYATRDRLKDRQLHIECILRLFQGMDVIELGSNSGILAYEISRWCKSYVGIEPDKEYFQQSLLTKKHIYNENVTFKNEHIQDKEYYCNAFIMCVALYLLSPKELGILTNRILNKCSVAIIQERTAKRPSNNGYNKYRLHESKRIRKFLKNCGFHAEIYYSQNNKYFEVIGVRD